MRRVWPAMPSDSPAVFVFFWVGPTFRLMRGHILGPAVRCLSGCWAQPSGLLRHAGGSFSYFMAVSPVVRSLGRQWPPIEWGADGRLGEPFLLPALSPRRAFSSTAAIRYPGTNWQFPRSAVHLQCRWAVIGRSFVRIGQHHRQEHPLTGSPQTLTKTVQVYARAPALSSGALHASQLRGWCWPMRSHREDRAVNGRLPWRWLFVRRRGGGSRREQRASIHRGACDTFQ
jgi:hypothetical protein